MSIASGRYLITGGCGQLGGSLAKCLRSAVGRDNVILSDIVKSPQLAAQGPFLTLDACNTTALTKAIKHNEITGIIHLPALLSATAEMKLSQAFDLNINSLSTVFLLAKEYNLQVFIPSTIAAFGPDSPLEFAPDICVQRPLSLYGVGKVYMERLGEYFNKVHGVDFRSLRYPGIISATQPGGGTTDYAIDVFFQGVKTNKYCCYLESKTRIPFAYIDDAMENTVRFILAPRSYLTQRVYNYGSLDLTPEELFASIKERCIPKLEITYRVDPLKQQLANNWPRKLDISNAVKDWDLKNVYDLNKMVDRVFEDVSSMKDL